MFIGRDNCRSSAYWPCLSSVNARKTSGTNNSDEDTSPAAPGRRFIYLAVLSISDGQPQFIAFSSTKFYKVYTRSQLLIHWPATTQDQQASPSQPHMLLYPYKDYKTFAGKLMGESRVYQATQMHFKRDELNNSDDPWLYLHLGTLQSASLQCFEWYSRSFHMKTHLLQPPWLRARISHRTPWKNSFFKFKQTSRVQLRGSKHLDACTRHST